MSTAGANPMSLKRGIEKAVVAGESSSCPAHFQGCGDQGADCCHRLHLRR